MDILFIAAQVLVVVLLVWAVVLGLRSRQPLVQVDLAEDNWLVDGGIQERMATLRRKSNENVQGSSTTGR